MTLSVIVPIPITDAALVSAPVPENDYPTFNAATTYAIGDRVISTVTHRIYESLRASNTGRNPTLEINRSGTAPWWLDAGPTNRWAAFDNEISTQTIGPSPMTFVLEAGACSALFLAGVDAEGIAVTVRDSTGGEIIASDTSDLEGSAPSDYLGYYYDRFKPATDYLLRDIPPYGKAEVTITLTRSTGNVAVGALIVGDERPIGDPQMGVKVKLVSFSYVKRDEFGKTSIKRRKSAKDMSVTAIVDREEADSVMETLRDVLDVPAVFIASEDPQQAALRCFGLGQGDMEYDEYVSRTLQLTVEGFI